MGLAATSAPFDRHAAAATAGPATAGPATAGPAYSPATAGSASAAAAQVDSVSARFGRMTITTIKVAGAKPNGSRSSISKTVDRSSSPSPSILRLPEELLLNVFSFIQTTTACVGKPPLSLAMHAFFQTCRGLKPYYDAFKKVSIASTLFPEIKTPLDQKVYKFLKIYIKEIDLSALAVNKDTNLYGTLPSCPHLRRFKVPSFFQLNDSAGRALQRGLRKIPTLTSLDLSAVRTDDFSGIQHLRTIREIFIKIYFPYRTTYLIQNPSLETLQRISLETAEQQWPRRKQESHSFGMTSALSQHLSQMKNLTSYHFDFSKNEDGGNCLTLDFFTQLGGLTSMTELTISSFTHIRGLGRIEGLKPLTQLKKLTLAPSTKNFDPIMYESPKWLNFNEAIRFIDILTTQFPQLEELILPLFSFSDQSIQYLLRLKNLKKLTLDLNSKATHKGLSELSKLTALETLQIAPATFQQLYYLLSSIEQLPKLERLEIDLSAMNLDKAKPLVQKFKNEHFLCRVLIKHLDDINICEYTEIAEEKRVSTYPKKDNCIIM